MLWNFSESLDRFAKKYKMSRADLLNDELTAFEGKKKTGGAGVKEVFGGYVKKLVGVVDAG